MRPTFSQGCRLGVVRYDLEKKQSDAKLVSDSIAIMMMYHEGCAGFKEAQGRRRSLGKNGENSLKPEDVHVNGTRDLESTTLALVPRQAE